MSKIYCNFIYSLLGIETVLYIPHWQFSRDCNFIYSLLGIETKHYIPVLPNPLNCNFIYSLLGIETWFTERLLMPKLKLQFHLLPIRDWNAQSAKSSEIAIDCNFIYSLLGIETRPRSTSSRYLAIAISFTPY